MQKINLQWNPCKGINIKTKDIRNEKINIIARSVNKEEMTSTEQWITIRQKLMYSK